MKRKKWCVQPRLLLCSVLRLTKKTHGHLGFEAKKWTSLRKTNESKYKAQRLVITDDFFFFHFLIVFHSALRFFFVCGRWQQRARHINNLFLCLCTRPREEAARVRNQHHTEGNERLTNKAKTKARKDPS